MANPRIERYLEVVLLSNGAVDVLGAVLMIAFPPFGLPIPGYQQLHYQTAFAVGGWGIAAFSFGVARLWASRQPAYRWYMATVGVLEGALLSLYCLARVGCSPTTLPEAALPLSISLVFGLAYAAALLWRARAR
jgi:hypothetical protein